MKKQGMSFVAAALFCLATATFALGQTTTTTTVTKAVQNPDGTYTIIEYPAKKEVIVNLATVKNIGAKGIATILRDDDGTRIKLSLTDIPPTVTALTLYAVDESGKVSVIGPVAISNGAGSLTASVPLTKFMLVASPEAALSAYDSTTDVLFRSAVPEGFTVIPMTSAKGEQVAAVAAPVTTVAPTVTTVAPTVTTVAPTVTTVAPTVTTVAPTVTAVAPTVTTVAPAVVNVPLNPAQLAYTVAMLNIPAYKKGDDTKIKVDFSGAMTGSRANVFITPRKDGPTEVKVNFHELKDSPSGQRFILWAVSPDNKFVKLGQVINTPGRNEAEIKSETSLPDFGLLVTMESAEGESPAGPAVGTIHIIPMN